MADEVQGLVGIGQILGKYGKAIGTLCTQSKMQRLMTNTASLYLKGLTKGSQFTLKVMCPLVGKIAPVSRTFDIVRCAEVTFCLIMHTAE